MTNRQIPPSYEAGLGSLALVHPTVLRAYRALNQTAVAFSLYPPPPAAWKKNLPRRHSFHYCLPAFPLDRPFPIPIPLSPLSQIDCMCSRELRGAQDRGGMDARQVWSSSRDSIDWNCNKYYTEMRFILCTWLREVCSCCFLTALPGPAWVLLNYVLQRILLISVCTQFS